MDKIAPLGGVHFFMVVLRGERDQRRVDLRRQAVENGVVCRDWRGGLIRTTRMPESRAKIAPTLSCMTGIGAPPLSRRDSRAHTGSTEVETAPASRGAPRSAYSPRPGSADAARAVQSVSSVGRCPSRSAACISRKAAFSEGLSPLNVGVRRGSGMASPRRLGRCAFHARRAASSGTTSGSRAPARSTEGS